MISIHTATRGWISGARPLGIATDGLIALSDLPPTLEPPRGGGHITGWGLGIDAKLKDLEARELRQRIIKDDQEIFELLAMITPTLH